MVESFFAVSTVLCNAGLRALGFDGGYVDQSELESVLTRSAWWRVSVCRLLACCSGLASF